jgi:hypothetical protein
MSKWTHAVCYSCWLKRYTHKPYRLIAPEPEPCCFCGKTTQSGIYIRENPVATPCGGSHPQNDNLDEE